MYVQYIQYVLCLYVRAYVCTVCTVCTTYVYMYVRMYVCTVCTVCTMFICTYIHVSQSQSSHAYTLVVHRWKYDAETQEIEQSIITNQVKCTKCGGIGHLATDCKVDM